MPIWLIPLVLTVPLLAMLVLAFTAFHG